MGGGDRGQPPDREGYIADLFVNGVDSVGEFRGGSIRWCGGLIPPTEKMLLGCAIEEVGQLGYV
jgi:hypothetical protein